MILKQNLDLNLKLLQLIFVLLRNNLRYPIECLHADDDDDDDDKDDADKSKITDVDFTVHFVFGSLEFVATTKCFSHKL